ncbi:hypothetical protein OFO16_11720 [Vibrio natriegens]|uniref:Flp family type IVb pilin n=1 Tax=Vibrio TaxID=662 RepID=UPI000243B200|nr:MULTISPECIES: hypothetical protein [Vibrio]AEX22982.1 fimbrial protein [Vibrio sp. EJY3]AXT71595.1 hypothetical protein DBX26_11290 [Vibrio sp. dhg]MEE3879485.1 hypothetical protein [Vibrio sp. YYF0003]UYI46501.1 hypothetical protein OFO16_11720 [Vibrio natriegens]
MSNLVDFLKDFWEDEEGLTLLEYILGAALIVTAFLSLGFWTGVKTSFGLVSGKIADEAS